MPRKTLFNEAKKVHSFTLRPSIVQAFAQHARDCGFSASQLIENLMLEAIGDLPPQNTHPNVAIMQSDSPVELPKLSFEEWVKANNA